MVVFALWIHHQGKASTGILFPRVRSEEHIRVIEGGNDFAVYSRRIVLPVQLCRSSQRDCLTVGFVPSL